MTLLPLWFGIAILVDFKYIEKIVTPWRQRSDRGIEPHRRPGHLRAASIPAKSTAVKSCTQDNRKKIISNYMVAGTPVAIRGLVRRYYPWRQEIAAFQHFELNEDRVACRVGWVAGLIGLSPNGGAPREREERRLGRVGLLNFIKGHRSKRSIKVLGGASGFILESGNYRGVSGAAVRAGCGTAVCSIGYYSIATQSFPSLYPTYMLFQHDHGASRCLGCMVVVKSFPFFYFSKCIMSPRVDIGRLRGYLANPRAQYHFIQERPEKEGPLNEVF